MAKIRLATVWLSGCSGCHMSFLDQDEKILELAGRAELVYSPIADVKDFPENVDVTLVEGAVGNEEQLELLKKIRRNSRVLVALGDCAVNGNVTALRNSLRNSDEEVLRRAYVENASLNQSVPEQVPRLLKRVLALNEVVNVDVYVPGCPPNAELISQVLNELLEGRTPVLEGRFKYG
ncbi:MAG: oxidoreductase [Thermoproteota archaeon]